MVVGTQSRKRKDAKTPMPLDPDDTVNIGSSMRLRFTAHHPTPQKVYLLHKYLRNLMGGFN